MVQIAEIDSGFRTIVEHMNPKALTAMLTERKGEDVQVGAYRVTRTRGTFVDKQKHFYTVYCENKKLYEGIALATTAKRVVEALIDCNESNVQKHLDADNQYASILFETVMYKQKAERTDSDVAWAKYTNAQGKLEQIKNNILQQNH